MLATMSRAALLLCFLSLASAYCPDFLKNQTACSCDDYIDGAVVKCSGQAGPAVVELLKKSHHELRELTLENAKLLELGARAFQNLRIKKLVMDRNHLHKLHKDAFKGLENVLQELHMEHNRFKEIPTAALSGLRALNVLNLKCNKIGNLTNGSFANMTSLIDVDLSCNEICEVNDKAFNGVKGTLQNLIMDDNCMSTVPKAVTNMKNLIALHMQRNKLSELGEGQFVNLTSLQMLKLNGNNISTIHGATLVNTPKIRYLMLIANNLKQLDGGSMAQFKNVQVLDLSHNFFEEITAEALTGMDSLQHLNFDSNAIRKVASGAFEGKPLILLWLPNNCLTSLNQQIFQGAPYLRQISITNNNIREILPSTFGHLANLQHLDLERNKILTLQQNSIPSSAHLTVRFQENPMVCTEDGFHVIQGNDAINLTTEANKICQTNWRAETEDVCPKALPRPAPTPCCVQKGVNIAQITKKSTTTTTTTTTTTEEPTTTTEEVMHTLKSHTTTEAPEEPVKETSENEEEEEEEVEETTTVATTTTRKINMDRFLRLQRGQLNKLPNKSHRKPSKYLATTPEPEEDEEEEYEEGEEEEETTTTTTTTTVKPSRRVPARVRDRKVLNRLPAWMARSKETKEEKVTVPEEDFNKDEEPETVQVDRPAV